MKVLYSSCVTCNNACTEPNQCNYNTTEIKPYSMGILTNSCYLFYSPAGESSDDELALTPVMAVSLADPAPEAIVRPEGMATHLANSYNYGWYITNTSVLNYVPGQL